jgi:hypothetical protein
VTINTLYYTSDAKVPGITLAQLARMDQGGQWPYIEHWFRRHFENPANETPWGDGQYQYVWGGPYNALTELEYEFGEVVPFERLEHFAETLESDGTIEWAPGPDHDDHRRAAEEWSEEHGDEPLPDFEYLVGLIQGGAVIETATPAETEARQELRARIRSLELEIERLSPEYGGKGHNRPPPDELPPPIPPEELVGLSAVVATMKLDLQDESLNPVEIGQTAAFLRDTWLGKKLDKMADKAAEGFGDVVGKGLASVFVLGVAHAAVPSIFQAICAVIGAAGHWLTVILAAHVAQMPF